MDQSDVVRPIRDATRRIRGTASLQDDFRTFCQELAKVVPSQRPRSSTTSGFGLLYSSLLCNPLTMEKAETLPLWSPVRTDDGGGMNGTNVRKGSSTRKQSFTAKSRSRDRGTKQCGVSRKNLKFYDPMVASQVTTITQCYHCMLLNLIWTTVRRSLQCRVVACLRCLPRGRH